MVQIQFAGQSQTISNQAYQKLCILLPYWGLKINKDNEIQGFYSPKDIKVSGLSDGTMMELNQLLSHTGIKVRWSDHPEFIISYKNNDSAPFSIRIRSVTYRFHPSPPHQTHPLQEHIFKNLWLPKRVQPVHILIDPMDSGRASEWLSYLLIQYVSPLEFRDLSSITLKDYQYFVSNYLMKINQDFASFQTLDPLTIDQWPTFPSPPSVTPSMDSTRKKPLFDLKEDENDALMKGEVINETEEIAQNSPSPINPFRPGFHHQDPDPINPFKVETSEQSIINPFRKKASKD